MSAASSQPPTTHIASIITALHGKPVEIIHPPSDEELFDRAFIAYAQVRWPDVSNEDGVPEDTDAIMHDARLALRELYSRLLDMRNEAVELRAELKLMRAERQRLLDALDEQGEELDRVRAR